MQSKNYKTVLRYFIRFAYNGKNYFGYQIQPNAVSVQETLETSLRLISKEQISITAAGRTDSGVHAREMFAHFDCENEIDADIWIKKLNSHLPKDIAVYDIFQVENTAHARFDALLRTYQYHIHRFKDPFLTEGSWHCHYPLNIEKMNEACKILFEYTDFECFSKVHTDVATFNCKITKAEWTQNGNNLIFTISADRFLRNMVRAIVGTMIDIGAEKLSLSDFRAVIESKNRSRAGFSVPAQGLYLVKVEYPYLTKRK